MKSLKNAPRELTTSGLRERVSMIVKTALEELIAIRQVSLCMKIINAHPVTIVRRTLTPLKLVLLVLSDLNKEVMNADQLIIQEDPLEEFQLHVSTVLEVSSANPEQLLFLRFAREVPIAPLDPSKKNLVILVSTAQQCQKNKLSVLLATIVLEGQLNTENVQLVLIVKNKVPYLLLALQVIMDQEIQTTSTRLLDVKSVEEVSILYQD
jgi:hypothetical protein